MSERDFFISFQKDDRSWAEWIAWILEANGYSVYVQAWDFRPGGNFVIEMQESISKSKRIIGVLSESFLESVYTQPEWSAAFASDPTGKKRMFLPIKVKKCNPGALLKAIIYIDLTSLNEKEAEERLINGLNPTREKPEKRPAFPGFNGYAPYFPNTPSPDTEIHDKYKELLEREFLALIDRLQNPQIHSRTSALLFGEAFPSGKKIIEPAISKYSLYLDIEKLISATVGRYESTLYRGVEDIKPHLIYKIATCRWRIYVSAIADELIEFDTKILYDPFVSGFGKSSDQKPELEIQKTVSSYIHYSNERNKKDQYLTTKNLLLYLGELASTNGVTLEDLLNEEQQKYRFISERELKNEEKHPRYFNLKLLFSDKDGSYNTILQAFSTHSINLVASKSWTLLPGEVAAAELLFEYKGNIDLKKEIEAVFTSERLSDIFIKYELNGPNRKMRLLSDLNPH